jgi:signal transduction histidine kinase/ligand-binding sensor domain-containing protein
MGVRRTALGVLLLCPCAFALDPALDVSQYAHTSWKIREGFSKGRIQNIAQTPDGYLWLGTEFGLLRFDGVRNVPWQPPPDERLPSSNITRLVAARDGTLWIGTWKGLASWRAGKLIQYPEFAGLLVSALLEDREGTVWVGTLSFPPPGRLCAIQKSRVHCYGEDGAFGYGIFSSFGDSRGNLWVGVRDGLWRWRPGTPKFYPLPGVPNGIQGLAEGDDGAPLIATQSGIRRLVNGKIEAAYPLPGAARQFGTLKLLRDRDGGLWIATSFGGLVHVHQGRTDVFSQSDGLSGDLVEKPFEDREGNIWVATSNGLDRFRNFAVTAFSKNQGFSNVGAVLASMDGSVWAGTSDGLTRWEHGQVTAYRERRSVTRAVPQGVREVLGSGLPDHLSSLFQDARGHIWVCTQNKVGYLDNRRLVQVGGIPGGTVHSIAEDTGGNLWIAHQDLGLYRLSQGNEVQQISWTRLGHKDHATALAADPSGGLWIGFFLGGVAHLKDGRIRASYAAADGLAGGIVNNLRLDRDGTLWAATEGGLSRLKSGRIAKLTGKNGLPCDAVHWVIEDDDHSFWLNTPCGLVRIARSELDAWTADSKRKVQTTVFDSSDGVLSHFNAGGYTPYVGKSPDGKLWFTTFDNLSVIDPHNLPFNKLPPPVHIEQITADRKRYDANAGLRLPPLVRDLQIDYTALSLVAPEKVLFRCKLEGYDSDWQDAGTRRQAFYTNLPPRNYRFRVMACNNSGVWNEATAFLDFAIDPAYYQTGWFRLSLVAAFLALLAALYQLWLQYLKRQFNIRLEERVNERTRLARDLHDTLLQSLSGVLLKLHGVTYLLPGKPDEARKTLGSVIDEARQAVTEGRDTVYGLRSSTVTTNDLQQSINSLGEELAAGPTGRNSPGFQVRVEGKTRDLHPIVRDEVNRIACEAVRNAFLHAQAGRIEVEIRYDERQFRLRVKDDGKGMDQKILEAGGRAGHFGLQGMRERAKLVGAKLVIWSELDSGTEIELTIPASVAYTKSPAAEQQPAS